MSESLREKAKRHPRLVNRLLAGGLILSLMLTLAMAVLMQTQQTTTNQMATQMAVAQATLDSGNAALRSQRLVSHARSLAEDGQVNLALAFALEAVDIPNPPLEAQRLLWDLMQMPAIERIFPFDYGTPLSLNGEILRTVDHAKKQIIDTNVVTGALIDRTAYVETTTESWVIPDLDAISEEACPLVNRATQQRVMLETCVFSPDALWKFSPDGRFFLHITDYLPPLLYNLKTGEHQFLGDVAFIAPYAVFSPDSHYLFISGGETYTRSPEAYHGARFVRFNTEDTEDVIVYDPPRGWMPLAVNSHNTVFTLSESASGVLFDTLSLGGTKINVNVRGVRDFEISPDGRTLTISEWVWNGNYLDVILVRNIPHFIGQYDEIVRPEILKQMGGGKIIFSGDGQRMVLTDIQYTKEFSPLASDFAIVTLYPNRQPDKVVSVKEPVNVLEQDSTTPQPEKYEVLVDYDDDAVVVLDKASSFEIQRWKLPVLSAAQASVSGTQVTVHIDNTLYFYSIEPLEALIERARTTRHIPEIECLSDVIYRDIAGCNTAP